MKLSRYITGKRIQRLLFLVILMGAAWTFDHFHQSNKKVLDEMEQTGTGKPDQSVVFFFNPASQVTFKLQAPRPFFTKIFTDTASKFLKLVHSLRTFHILKAEPLITQRPLWLIQHHLNFSYFFTENPDDSASPS